MSDSFKSKFVIVGFAALLAVSNGPLRADDRPERGVVLRMEGLGDRHAELKKRIESTPNRAMTGPGLAGAMGGVNVKIVALEPQEILLPIPQHNRGQAPISLFVRSDPENAVTDFRLWDRGEGEFVLRVKLDGKIQDVRLEWSSVVLLWNQDVPPDPPLPKPFRSETGCVQSRAPEVTKLAEKLWPASGKVIEFAANIQRHILEMKRIAPPRSLDAVGILKSGMNGICTANANLAAALMRAKGIACRTMAVIPPNGMKLEMHRIVEFYDNGKWIAFDPSSLTLEIPAKPWRNIVMAKTTTRDEEAAMTPRMGAMIGCPYGQEAELLTRGVMLFGQDFFWTTAKPLMEFSPDMRSCIRAKTKWTIFLKTGQLSSLQLEAGAARSAQEFKNSFSR